MDTQNLERFFSFILFRDRYRRIIPGRPLEIAKNLNILNNGTYFKLKFGKLPTLNSSILSINFLAANLDF